MEPRLRFNLDDLLKQHKLKASDLSKLTGIPKQTLSEWRSGLVPKSILSLKKVAQTFGISLDELVFRPVAAAESVYSQSLAEARKLSESLGGNKAMRHEALIGLSANGLPLFISPAYQERVGWSQDIISQRSLFEFILGSDCEAFQRALQTSLTSMQPSSLSCRLLCSELRILQQRCVLVPLASSHSVLVIFYAESSSNKTLSKSTSHYDDIVSMDLKVALDEIRRNFQSLQPHLRLDLATLPSDLSFFSRRNTFSQLVFSCLQEIAPFDATQAIPAGQVLELVAYRDEQALELNIRSPVAAASSERQSQLSLAPFLKPALGAQVEFKDWGSLRQVVITLPIETPSI